MNNAQAPIMHERRAVVGVVADHPPVVHSELEEVGREFKALQPAQEGPHAMPASGSPPELYRAEYYVAIHPGKRQIDRVACSSRVRTGSPPLSLTN
jgi:hypothetical protein